jgi:hypothetical protein
MNLQELTHQQLYDELERVIRHWQALDAEWTRRWIAIQAYAKEKEEAVRTIQTPDQSPYQSEAIDSLYKHSEPLTIPFAQMLPDPPLGSGLDSGFSGGGGESGGAGSTGDW